MWLAPPGNLQESDVKSGRHRAPGTCPDRGHNAGAALNKAKLVRKTNQGQKEIPLPLKKMLSARIPDMQLQPGDIIFVPSSTAKSAAKRGFETALQAAVGIAIYRP